MPSIFTPAVAPMQPTLVREPFHRDAWIYEEKFDGWRIVAYKDGDRVRLVSRNGRDHTARFGDIAGAVAKVPARALILDGEVCAFDANLVSHIYLLEASPDEPAAPPVLMALDCLFQRGRDVRDRPLSYRRGVLEEVVDNSRHVYAARRLVPHGLDAWAEVSQRGYEALIAKDSESAYRAGKSPGWSRSRSGRGVSSWSVGSAKLRIVHLGCSLVRDVNGELVYRGTVRSAWAPGSPQKS